MLGGVSDYTRLVASELARAGDEVEVWVPACGESAPSEFGVRLHRLPGHYGPRATMILEQAVAKSKDHRILVQYVPHAFGFKAMNLLFCCWLFARRRRNITVMFHEVAFPWRAAQPIRHNLLGQVTWVMAMLVARSASRIFVSSASWEELLRRMLPAGRPVTALPVPSNVPVIDDANAVRRTRLRYQPTEGLVVGHFGTYGPAVRSYLERLAPKLLEDPRVTFILLGRGGTAARRVLLSGCHDAAGRVHATGGLTGKDLSLHLSSCDLLIQPYPDGISTRRGSAMAALAHGRPIITTSGHLTEPLWAESGAVTMVPSNEAAAIAPLAAGLLDNAFERQRLGSAAATLYRERFDVRHTISALRN
jgi:glycosyltransferase involved in cell wall biosynthesis